MLRRSAKLLTFISATFAGVFTLAITARRPSGERVQLPNMKLILKFEDNHSVPCAWCEVCDREITDAEMAMVYWRIEDYASRLHSPLLVHKQCMNASRSQDEAYACSMELTTYLVFLQNTGLTGSRLNRAFRNAALMETVKTD